MKTLVDTLCSERCAGRRPGTPEGEATRDAIRSALREAGLDAHEQAVPGCGGANVLGTIPGHDDRWIVVGAHHDHLGQSPEGTYWGADDNAAAIAILVEVARGLAGRKLDGRGVVIASFDGEEPPYFMTEGMGSEHYARNPIVPLERTDFMVCMDLVGHSLGPSGVPDDVRQTLFALGAERSAETGQHVDDLGSAVEGVRVRRADAEIIPPLSDYEAFWQREVPFLFLTAGRSRVYHTPEDVPAALDYPKMRATATWLERFVRETCRRERIESTPHRHHDASTLRSMVALTESLAAISPQAGQGLSMASALLDACDASGALPEARRGEAQMLVAMLEAALR